MNDPIGDELRRLNKELNRLLGKDFAIQKPEELTVEQLAKRYGLTLEEANGWLEQEPNFTPSQKSADEKKHLPRTDEEGTEPPFIRLL